MMGINILYGYFPYRCGTDAATVSFSNIIGNFQIRSDLNRFAILDINTGSVCFRCVMMDLTAGNAEL